ncbi:MAG TPA: hypothetical protein VFD70_28915 [Anaerolineae bacterium]|nr:hypothetical protein [Anaerolineae bacterium]
MSVKEVEMAVSHFTAEELAEFRAWLEEFAAEMWDKEFEEDVAAGRLDALAEEALRDLDEGRCTEL